MPPIRSSASKRRTRVVLKILSLGEIIPTYCEAICLGCTVGGRQAEQGSRESMEKDDMVMRVGSSLRTERDEPRRRTRGLQAQGSL